MFADKVIYNIKTLYTSSLQAPLRGKDLAKIDEYHNAFIAIKNGKILAFGEGSFSKYISIKTKKINAEGKIVLPGFIDSHSHLVHASSREEEFALLKKGYSYLDILKQGGGILNTVSKTRASSFSSLLKQAKTSLLKMLSYGVTTLEVKSGYGLDLINELKQLEVIKVLNEEGPVKLVATYMGAHALPLEYKGKEEEYVASIIRDLEVIKRLDYVEMVDVFCEECVFSPSITKHILTKAQDLNFKIRLHADEIKPLGGAELGVSLGAVSVDHLLATSLEGIKALGKSNTLACLLPGTSFFLQKPFAKARLMLENNVAIAIGGDYNPGTCPTENFQFIMHLACNYLNLSPEEVLNAVTINPAYLLGLADTKGSIAVGKDADILLLDSPNLAYMLYHFGINHVSDVYIQGKKVVSKQRIERNIL